VGGLASAQRLKKIFARDKIVWDLVGPGATQKSCEGDLLKNRERGASFAALGAMRSIQGASPVQGRRGQTSDIGKSRRFSPSIGRCVQHRIADK